LIHGDGLHKLYVGTASRGQVTGTVVPYILKGVPSTDIVGGILSGAVVVDTSGTANINIAIAQHQTTDILTVNVADQNIQVTLVGVKGG